MARNDEGEFELVLGNKQLLSVFFILVVLLGVFFTMGYIVGRNNPSADAVNIAMARRPAGGAGAPREVDPGAAVDRVPAAAPAPVQTPIPPPPGRDREPEPVRTPPPAETPKPAPAAAPAPVAQQTTGGVVSSPAPGSYLQVAAIDQKGAVILADSLRKKAFPAVVAPGPGGLFRVVVGPLATPEDVARTRTRLEEVGIKGAMARRYKSE